MIDPVALAAHYSRFRVSERVLLTGHSHQAWPDVAFEGQQEAWLDAAALVDDKWGRAMEVADEVASHWRRRLGDIDGEIALGQNTHELILRVLSSLDWRGRGGGARLVTTDGEFHTLRRQLDRLSEEGVEVVKAAARPAPTLADRLAREVTTGTRAVFVSSVLFETAELVPHLGLVAAAAERHGAALVVDAYHQVNAVPFDAVAAGLSRAFVVGGGYKYCQLGEGNCFLRVPPDVDSRPVITGWFSEFAELAEAKRPGDVRYGVGAARWAGSTYDPTSHYRARAVFRFFRERGMRPEALRETSVRQVARLANGVERLDLDPGVARVAVAEPEARAGFLAIDTPRAGDLVAALRARGVWADSRGRYLRLGPAPYVTDAQLDEAVGHLGELLSR